MTCDAYATRACVCVCDISYVCVCRVVAVVYASRQSVESVTLCGPLQDARGSRTCEVWISASAARRRTAQEGSGQDVGSLTD